MTKTSLTGNNRFEQLVQQISDYPACAGIRQIDIINLPDVLITVFNKITRQGDISTSEFAADLSLNMNEAFQLANLLAEKGYLARLPVSAVGEQQYQINFARQPKRRLPSDVWQKLDLL